MVHCLRLIMSRRMEDSWVDDLDSEPLLKLLLNFCSLIWMSVRTAHHLLYYRLRIDW